MKKMYTDARAWGLIRLKKILRREEAPAPSTATVGGNYRDRPRSTLFLFTEASLWPWLKCKPDRNILRDDYEKSEREICKLRTGNALWDPLGLPEGRKVQFIDIKAIFLASFAKHIEIIREGLLVLSHSVSGRLCKDCDPIFERVHFFYSAMPS